MHGGDEEMSEEEPRLSEAQSARMQAALEKLDVPYSHVRHLPDGRAALIHPRTGTVYLWHPERERFVNRAGDAYVDRQACEHGNGLEPVDLRTWEVQPGVLQADLNKLKFSTFLRVLDAPRSGPGWAGA